MSLRINSGGSILLPSFSAYANGAQPRFEDTREGFRLPLPLSLLSDKRDEGTEVAGVESGTESRHTHGQVTGQVTGQVGEQVTGQVGEQVPSLESRLESKLAAKVFASLQQSPKGKAELASMLGHATVSGELHKQIRRLLDAELIERTIPEKPNSRLQKYRLTEKGRKTIVALKNK